MALADRKVIFLEKVLHDIREAETHADTLIAEAKEKAAHILTKGKADADAFVVERKQKVLEQKAEALSFRKKELEKEQQKFLKKAEKQADDAATTAVLHKKKALSFLSQEFKTILKA